MLFGNQAIHYELGNKGLISPYDKRFLQPASYDVGLCGPFLFPQPGRVLSEVVEPHYVKVHEADDTEGICLRSGEFCLASTLETIRVPLGVAAQIAGKSTLGRLGLAVHVTAGFIDPGFSGQITLELANLGPSTIRLAYGQRIAQIQFYRCFDNTMGYSGKYQNQRGTTGARRGKSE